MNQKQKPVNSRSVQRRVAAMRNLAAPDFSFDPTHYSIVIKNELHEGQWYFVSRVQELPDVAVYERELLPSYKVLIGVITDLHAVAKNDGLAFPEPIPLDKRDEPAHAQCIRCHRKTYDKSEFGSVCNQKLPSGRRCLGTMRKQTMDE